MSSLDKNRIIIKNTLFLYMRMIVVMAINLYVVRVVLNSLGQEDYGIYNVVAGIVTMLTSVSSVLSSATMRFYSYNLGAGHNINLKEIFSTSVNIYILFSIIVLFLSETLGLWFVNTRLSIPINRIESANIIYQLSIVSFISTIMSSPFSASIIARESMGIYSIISLLDCFVRLIGAKLLDYYSGDKLIFYGAIIMFSHIIVLSVYIILCRKHPECKYCMVRDKSLYSQLLSYSGWSMYGSVARVLNIQGNTMLINMFFGAIVSGARAISIQIGTALQTLCDSFVTAIRPPIIKSYAEGNIVYMFKLFNFSNKFIYYSLLIVSMPLILNMDTILQIWLKVYDNDMIVFSRLMLIYSVILMLHHPITMIISATGSVKSYFVPVESVMLLCMPFTYVLYSFGFSAKWSYYIMILLSVIAHLIRLSVLKRQFATFSIRSYFIEFALPAILITLFLYFILNYIGIGSSSFTQLFSDVVLSVIITASCVFLFALKQSEKKMIKDIFYKS